jgi:hypothetical protein
MTAEFDVDAVSRAISEALTGPGGIFLGVNVFASVPGVVHTPARRGFLRSEPERVQIGDWRYEVARDGRLAAAHVVNDIVIADEVLDAVAIGPHVARALAQLVGRFGPAVLPSIDAAVDALITGSGRH